MKSKITTCSLRLSKGTGVSNICSFADFESLSLQNLCVSAANKNRWLSGVEITGFRYLHCMFTSTPLSEHTIQKYGTSCPNA